MHLCSPVSFGDFVNPHEVIKSPDFMGMGAGIRSPARIGKDCLENPPKCGTTLIVHQCN